MASGARRFENRVYYTGPSPGDYRRQQALEDRSFSRASTSAAFQDKVSGMLDGAHKYPIWVCGAALEERGAGCVW